jgi:hypothetical protein
MRRRWIVAGLFLVGAGCNRQDAECLGRIGKLVGRQVAQLKPDPGTDAALGRTIPGYKSPTDKSSPMTENK